MAIDFGEGLEEEVEEIIEETTPKKATSKKTTARKPPTSKEDPEREQIRQQFEQILEENAQIRQQFEQQNSKLMGEILELNEQMAEMGREGDKDLELLATLKNITETVKILDTNNIELIGIYKNKIKRYNITKLFELDWSKIRDKLINLSPDAYGGKYKTITERLISKRQKYLLLPFFDFINTIVLKRDNINNYVVDEFIDNILPLNLDPITIETIKEFLLEQFESIK